MNTPSLGRLAEFKTALTLLKDRERSLQHIAQSPHTSDRPGAEQELGRVREEIRSNYARMRPLKEHD